MLSVCTEKSVSIRHNLLNQNKLTVSRRIFVCSPIKLSPISPDPGQLLRVSCDSTGVFVLKAQDVSLLLGLLQMEACPFLPKTSLKGGLCRLSGDTLPPPGPFKNLSGQTLFESNPFDLCSLLRTETETEIVLDFKHSCVTDLS